MNRSRSISVGLPGVLCVLVATAGTVRAARPPSEPPDLTASNSVDLTQTYNLGPTGLRGWIYTKAESNLDASQGRTTTQSRQILVTHVGTNTPAYGTVEVNDVILGVGDAPFSDDARKSFGRAITEAEKQENQGSLKLLLFRAGKTMKVDLKLRVLGSYSDTAPYDCPKSKRILAEASKILEKEPLQKGLWGAVNGLALLATGDTTVPSPTTATSSTAAGRPTTTRTGAAAAITDSVRPPATS